MLSDWNLAGMALVAVLCFIAGYSRKSKTELKAETKIETRIETRTVALLIALGAALRIWQLFVARDAVLPEELRTILQARSLLADSKSLEGFPWPVILSGWGGEAEGALLIWLSMPLVALFGSTVLAVRLPMLLLSVFSLWVLWDLIRRAFSSRAAFWALLLAVVAPWQLMASRWPLTWQLLPYLLLISAWMLTKKRPAWFIAGMCVLGLSMYTFDAAWYTVPLLALLWAVLVARRRGVRLPVAAAGVAAFLLTAAPVLLALLQGSVAFPHEHMLVGIEPRPVTSLFYLRATTPDQQGYGPQLLPFFKDSPGFASLFLQLSANGYKVLESTALQYTNAPIRTAAYLLPDWGFLYIFLIPLTFFGAVSFMARNKKRRHQPNLAADLLVAWPLCALPFLLLFGELTPLHNAALLYPLLLCTACGARAMARRFRPISAALGLLCVAGALAFSVWGFDPAPTLPGLKDALAYAREQSAQQVVVTTYHVANESPARAAIANTMTVFDLDAAYVRGEREEPGMLPYRERFWHVSFLNNFVEREEGATFEADPLADAVYVMHHYEALMIDANRFVIEEFGEFVVARGR
ncbi:MAG: glycosyltransferase family 39 protein [Clostridia bacterium]|nr:glycosyltransferase family 39 protein [Clostridia bacterium]